MNNQSPHSTKSTRLKRALAMPYLAGWIIGGIFLLLGTIITLVAGEPLVRLVSSYQWTQAPGVVQSAEIITKPTRRRGLQAFVRVDIRFRVEGREWTMTQPDLMEIGDLDLKRAEARAQSLRANPHVMVIVDPSDPTRSVISRGELGTILLHFVILIFPVVGITALTITTLSWAYVESGRPRRGFLGWWGGLGGRILNSPNLETYGIRLLVLVPMGLVTIGVLLQNWIVAGIGAFFGWGVWQASRKNPRRRKH